MTVALLQGDPQDEALRAQVQPADWQNPSPPSWYNLVVVGAGPAGLVAAAGAAGLGARVALVERQLLGGDCLNVGCVPSKALLRSARAAAAVRDAGAFGIRTADGPQVDFAAVMQRLRRLRAELSANDSAVRFRGLGVDVFLGNATFTGPTALAVAGRTLHFRHAIIATGARPAEPAIPGLNAAGFLTNETVFALTELPRRLAIVGAGPVGCELAQAFARFGAQVWLFSDAAQVLPREEWRAAELVQQALTRDGVQLCVGTTIAAVESAPDGKAILLNDGRRVGVDTILVAAGRTPNVDGLNLEAAGVAYDARAGIHVDDRLRTANRRIFAAGDVCSRFRFTHAADALARIALQNALFHGRARVSRLVIPWCTYTDPEVARVGLSASEARDQGLAVQSFVQELTSVDRAVLDGATPGYVEVLTRAGSDRLVGATIVAPHAGEMIGEVALAMTHRLGLRRFANTIHPYPTQAEALKKLGDAYNRTRLTPTVQWLFRHWFRWTQ